MRENMEERAERLALYIIENRATVRAAARTFAVSKSTVHTDATKRNGAKGRTVTRLAVVPDGLTGTGKPAKIRKKTAKE